MFKTYALALVILIGMTVTFGYVAFQLGQFAAAIH